MSVNTFVADHIGLVSEDDLYYYYPSPALLRARDVYKPNSENWVADLSLSGWNGLERGPLDALRHSSFASQCSNDSALGVAGAILITSAHEVSAVNDEPRHTMDMHNNRTGAGTYGTLFPYSWDTIKNKMIEHLDNGILRQLNSSISSSSKKDFLVPSTRTYPTNY
ncbi:MAG: DUF6973 domain-containing protein [bacterium]